jgi:hypothetical protein
MVRSGVVGVGREEGGRTATGLDSITTLPNHSADGSAAHVWFLLVYRSRRVGGWVHTLDESGEEGLGGQIGVWILLAIAHRRAG